MAYMRESDWQTVVRDLTAERDELARRLRDVEERVQRLLGECDRNERHIRKNVPHLPPDGGSFSVHVIRKYLRDAPPHATDGDA